MTIQQAFEGALRQHQSGQLAVAEASYRRILAVDPCHADALHLLGVIAHQMGRHSAAVDFIRQAIALAPGTPDYHANLGEAHRAAGQFDQSIAASREAIRLRPDHAAAHCNLGAVLRETGRSGEAIASCRRAIALEPELPEAYYQLGRCLYEEDQLSEAIAAYRGAIALQPSSAEAHCHLGNALHRKGEGDEAVAAYLRAIELWPEYPNAHHNLGVALHDAGDVDGAIAAYGQAIALRPDLPETYSHLGTAYFDKNRLDEAIAACRQAIELRPDYAEAHSNLGVALREKGQLEEAIAACRKAIALQPDLPEAHHSLGGALRNQGLLDEAITACRRAIALRPDYAEAFSNLGLALCEAGHLDEAILACRRAIALQPTLSAAHNNLGNASKDQGHLDEAMAAYRQAIALRPDFASAHSNLLLALHYHPDMDARTMAGEHRAWDEQHAEPLRHFTLPLANDRDPERRLRIGYVSPDFREHSVACFFENLLACHDATEVEVFCYANVTRPDEITARLQLLAAHWHNVVGMPDAEVAELLRHHGIDVLIDLAGHTARHRLLVFARKPAPVQATWLGYPDSTGLRAMNYRLTDAYADPVEVGEQFDREQLIRLPRCAWCFRPSSDAPPVNAPPVRQTGHITFGCFNARPKINAPLLMLWSQILRATPGSRLLLKNYSSTDSSTKKRIHAAFADAGISPDRIELAAYASTPGAHLASYARVDIALDTFPYHGATTTCEALWMGVPVVTFAGQTHASRVGVSLLTNVGLPELVGASPEQYLQTAVDLALDIPRLTELRGTLRERMAASPLLDGPRFARDVEAAYREIWRRWCRAERPV